MARKLISTTEAARILGISRVAVFKRIKNGQIPAIKVGRNYVIDRRDLGDIFQEITPASKNEINKAVDRTIKEYGEVLQRLGKE